MTQDAATPMGGLCQSRLNALIDGVAKRDARVRAALSVAGYPPERRRVPGFRTLLAVIASQQLSVKAAGTIFSRLMAALEGEATPAAVLQHTDETLRRTGLSRSKVVYVKSLATAVADGSLPLAQLAAMSDEEVIRSLTAVKGIGRWSAEMYLISSLGREDVWPLDDLGVQEGVGRFLKLAQRPGPRDLATIGEAWRPARTAMAIFAWHYYAQVPI